MPLLQVRNCPEDIYRRISGAAKKQNRTLAQQTLVLLEKGLNQEQSRIERRKQLLEKIQARDVPKGARKINVVAWIREDRKR